MTLVDTLGLLPPIFCRLMARSDCGRKLATDEMMVKRTGWSLTKVRRMSLRTSWAKWPVEDVDIFFRACGGNWSNTSAWRNRIKWALERGGIEHLRHVRYSRRNTHLMQERIVSLYGS